jgi:Restriction endonuclease NotI
MNRVLELFGRNATDPSVRWPKVIGSQQCPFLQQRCYKVRKSDPNTSIGTCTVLQGKPLAPVVICPKRLIHQGQVFNDCLHLLTTHEPGNELHVVSEVSVPGGSVDYVLVSAKKLKVRDFVGIELQTLDTTGTVWPERQRLVETLGVRTKDKEASSSSPFGMNWKMTAKTTLMQMHHKVQTFEHVNKKLVLVVQDRLLSYMTREFRFGHFSQPARIGDAMHLHAYALRAGDGGAFGLELSTRLSTDTEGVGRCLGLQAEARVELARIVEALEAKISTKTLLRIV